MLTQKASFGSWNISVYSVSVFFSKEILRVRLDDKMVMLINPSDEAQLLYSLCLNMLLNNSDTKCNANSFF